MRKRWATIYAFFLLAIMLAGIVTVFVLAWQSGVNDCVKAIVGFIFGII